MEQQAFILRIQPGWKDRLPEALESDQIIMGWSEVKGLLDEKLEWAAFRERVGDTYHPNAPNWRAAGKAAGNLWLFIRDMQTGDLVVVPCESGFYLAEIEGSATYDPSKTEDDTSYRRKVKWLNEKKPIPRDYARSALLSRMKIRGTSARASDLLSDIKDCRRYAGTGQKPSFHRELQQELINITLKEIQSGHMSPDKFEELIKGILIELGGKGVQIVPKKIDKGADVVATFTVAGAISLTVAVQAKHWQPKPPVGPDVIENLIKGIEHEGADLGMIVTTGNISPEAEKRAKQYLDEENVWIEMVDGNRLAKLMVEQGVRCGQD